MWNLSCFNKVLLKFKVKKKYLYFLFRVPCSGVEIDEFIDRQISWQSHQKKLGRVDNSVKLKIINSLKETYCCVPNENGDIPEKKFVPQLIRTKSDALLDKSYVISSFVEMI